MSKMTLYEMAAEGRELVQLLLSRDADDQTIQDTLASIGLDIGEKGGGYIAVVKELEVLEAGFEAEEKRLANNKKVIQNRKKLLLDRMKYCAEELGLNKIETSLGTISIRKNPPALKINDPEAIPASFITIIPETTEPNKKAILDVLKEKKEVSGCELTQGTHLRIT